METRSIKDDTTSTKFSRLFEASQFVKCRWNLLESNSRWGFCHRVLTILHEKRKAKKQTNQNKKGPRPIFSRYSMSISTGHSFVASHADALLARHAIVSNERAIVRKKSVTKPSERLRKRVQCFSVVGSSLPWSATVWFILENVFTCIDSKWKPTKQMQSTLLIRTLGELQKVSVRIKGGWI